MTFDPALAVPPFIALGLMTYALFEGRRVRLARKWSKIPARVVRSRVITLIEPVEGGEVIVFQPQVLYEYQFAGQSLRSVELCLDEGAYRFSKWEKAQELVRRFPAAQNIEISCSELGQTVLLDDIDGQRKQHYVAWFVFGLLISSMTPLLMWHAS